MVRKKPTNMVEHGVVSALSFIGIVWTYGENRPAQRCRIATSPHPPVEIPQSYQEHYEIIIGWLVVDLPL